jgi:hypothetical protein
MIRRHRRRSRGHVCRVDGGQPGGQSGAEIQVDAVSMFGDLWDRALLLATRLCTRIGRQLRSGVALGGLLGRPRSHAGLELCDGPGDRLWRRFITSRASPSSRPDH